MPSLSANAVPSIALFVGSSNIPLRSFAGLVRPLNASRVEIVVRELLPLFSGITSGWDYLMRWNMLLDIVRCGGFSADSSCYCHSLFTLPRADERRVCAVCAAYGLWIERSVSLSESQLQVLQSVVQ